MRGVLLLAALLGLAPAAAACHAGPGQVVYHGVVARPDGPALAALPWPDWEICDGPVELTLTWLAPAGGQESFRADVEVLTPHLGFCLPLTCHPIPPAGVFTVRNATLGVDLVGVYGNGLHMAFSVQLAGTYRDLPAAFQLVAG